MKPFRILSLMLCTFTLLGCGNKNSADHAEEGHEEEHEHGSSSEGASFVEGKGIRLIPETRKAIDFQIADVEENLLRPRIFLEAQIFRAAETDTPHTLASAYVESEFAKELTPGAKATFESGGQDFKAVLLRVESFADVALERVEAIFKVSDPAYKLRVGNFLSGSMELSSTDEKAIVIPSSAVLQTAAGKFAYVENGKYFLRTPIAAGKENNGFIEITDGLFEGDRVATNPVETLYLIELRATKGGGHSH